MKTEAPQPIDIATKGLAEHLPIFAANQPLALWQRRALWIAPLAGAVLVFLSYWFFYFGVSFYAFLGLMLFMAALLRYVPVFFVTPPIRLSYHAPSAEMDYPIYTVLVPLFQEAHMLDSLMAHLYDLNWPRSRLDVKLVLEQADNETRNAAARLKLEEGFEIIIVPDHPPRTKGKACNYALLSARGEFTTIFDAEDDPDPDQLLRAWHVFQNSPADIACLQTPLGFFNQEENWLTRQATIEYVLQFLYFLPFVVGVSLPVFLGGSSNHFRTHALRAVGAWDPYNVTEDADIGLRLRRTGWHILLLPSLTKEEAVPQLGFWFKQRARWIKGWIQTWLVAMRSPRRLLGELGFYGFVYLQLLVPIYLLSLFVHLIIWPVVVLIYFSNPVYSFVIGGSVLIAYFFVIIAAQFGCRRIPLNQRARDIPNFTWMIPIYWYLVALAAFYAIIQLVRNPYHWDKTPHGISKIKPT